jgi:hypothetical protein
MMNWSYEYALNDYWEIKWTYNCFCIVRTSDGNWPTCLVGESVQQTMVIIIFLDNRDFIRKSLLDKLEGYDILFLENGKVYVMGK